MTLPDFPDGWYQSADVEAEMLGFGADNFCGQFTKKGDTIIVLYIYSLYPGKGNTQRFLQGLVDMGWTVVVVKPNEVMMHICRKLGFTKYEECVEGYYSDCPVVVCKH